MLLYIVRHGIPDYATDTLTVTATAARNGYKYRCIVTDAYGNETVSETATLTVE